MLIFSTFKSSADHRAYNAVHSWQLIKPRPVVLLIGEETEALAEELGTDYVSEVARNDQGTPLLDDIYYIAQHRYADEEIFAYVNGDIIFFNGLHGMVAEIASDSTNFLIVGQRKDVEINERLHFNDMWQLRLMQQVAEAPFLSPCGADYFIFRKGMFGKMPPFAIGRTSFDNWMIYDCLQREIPVFDATEKIVAIHQNHEEAKGLRGSPEATCNRRLVEKMYPKWTPWDGWISHANTKL